MLYNLLKEFLVYELVSAKEYSSPLIKTEQESLIDS